MRGAALPGATRTARGTFLRTLVFVFLATFLWLQLHVISLTGRDSNGRPSTNETLFALVPRELHRFLKDRRNASSTTTTNASAETLSDLEIEEIRRNVRRANFEQRVYNEEAFGPLAPDAPVIVVQVHQRLTYLRHLIVSLAQAKGIEQTLVVFSHDVWNPDINYLVQSVDFCRVLQIFYPHSIQTHPRSFPGEDPSDCPRNIRKEQALGLGCLNAKHPDLYGHYREAKFTQTKHHWWWKANRVFDRLAVTRNHTGMVLFLEEDHYVAEDFLHVLGLMERTGRHSCERCNVLSLGTYLKTYNYLPDFGRKFLGVNGVQRRDLPRESKRRNASTFSRLGDSIAPEFSARASSAFTSTTTATSSAATATATATATVTATATATATATVTATATATAAAAATVTANTNDDAAVIGTAPALGRGSGNASATASLAGPLIRWNSRTARPIPTWAFQLLPGLYDHYQKAEVIPWISSKHNMGMAFNRVTWSKLRKCAAQFCAYDDYNWDWSLQHIAQTCLPPSRGAGPSPRLESGLIAMMMRAPRVFHIGECGVHHKKNNCESTAAVAKVRSILRAARNHLFPSRLTLTVAGTTKKTKLRRGNGGWGDVRDHRLCWNITVDPDLDLP